MEDDNMCMCSLPEGILERSGVIFEDMLRYLPYWRRRNQNKHGRLPSPLRQGGFSFCSSPLCLSLHKTEHRASRLAVCRALFRLISMDLRCVQVERAAELGAPGDT